MVTAVHYRRMLAVSLFMGLAAVPLLTVMH